MSNENLIDTFYTAFSNGDAAGMIACYADDAIFSDPVFGRLEGQSIFDMWTMLIKRSKGNMEIKYGEIFSDGENASVDWVATYPYGPRQLVVVNFVHANITIRDGKIVEHHDNFDLWQWSRQALGLTGTILGWSGFIQNKIRKNAADMLKWYQNKK